MKKEISAHHYKRTKAKKKAYIQAKMVVAQAKRTLVLHDRRRARARRGDGGGAGAAGGGAAAAAAGMEAGE